MRTEKPARKHRSLHSLRTWPMASMVCSEAPGISYWTIIMVESPEKKMSRRSSGIISVGIWMPTRLETHVALDTPGTCSISLRS